MSLEIKLWWGLRVGPDLAAEELRVLDWHNNGFF